VQTYRHVRGAVVWTQIQSEDVTMVKVVAVNAKDHAALQALYSSAFPEEDLSGLVQELLETKGTTHLITYEGDTLVGHVCFTPCDVAQAPVALLGPLAVAPDHQGKGIGSALVREGIKAMQAQDMRAVMVLGDPAYYGRFGFHTNHAVQGHRDMPLEWASAWQGMSVDETPLPKGAINLPAVWDKGTYWSDQSSPGPRKSWQEIGKAIAITLAVLCVIAAIGLYWLVMKLSNFIH